MAELNLKQIIDRLNAEFTGDNRKLVFWYDDKGEFAEDMDSVVLDNAKIYRLEPDNQFYTKRFHKETQKDVLYGFPIVKGAWCNSRLKMEARKKLQLNSDDIEILGIAADEPKRIERHQKRDDVILPLVEIGWTEAMCREWCEKNDLLSPIYTTATRGGCWFCHNQGVDQLRLLRRDYPELWALLLKWDNDSPVTFKPDGHTVHDFDRRFQAEDDGIILPNDRKFRWSQIDGEVQIKFF
jgi:hypothetical protein